MNELIQQEIVSILREMRTGAPGAWQELVAQRVAYCSTMATMCFIASAVLLVIFVVTSVRSCRLAKKQSEDVQLVVAVVISVLCLISLVCTLSSGISHYVTSIAPLGQVLGRIG